jgi:hypothetical protein
MAATHHFNSSLHALSNHWISSYLQIELYIFTDLGLDMHLIRVHCSCAPSPATLSTIGHMAKSRQRLSDNSTRSITVGRTTHAVFERVESSHIFGRGPSKTVSLDMHATCCKMLVCSKGPKHHHSDCDCKRRRGVREGDLQLLIRTIMRSCSHSQRPRFAFPRSLSTSLPLLPPSHTPERDLSSRPQPSSSQRRLPYPAPQSLSTRVIR